MALINDIYNLREFGVTAVILTPARVVGGARAAADDIRSARFSGSGACPKPLVLPSKTFTFHKNY